MGTATCRRAAPALAALALAGAGCGTAGRPSSPAGSDATGEGFALLQRAAAPSGWRSLETANGATLSYPPGWTPAGGDAGTATAVLRSGGKLIGYLNVTPGEGEETLADWVRFRLDHNAREGDREVKEEASARGVRFRTGTGTCLRDRYTTGTGARYIELACIVKGAAATSVIVAASPPQAWARVAPSLYRSLSALRT